MKRIFTFFVPFLFVLPCWAEPADAEVAFVHPGALNTSASLELVRAKIKAGDQPWKGEFEALKQSSLASRSPHPLVSIHSKSADEQVSMDDAQAAYAQALLWTLTGQEAYAKRAISILNAWSKLQGFSLGTDQDKLLAGWLGAVFAQSAEIMRSYQAWSPTDVAAFREMLKRVFYPQLSTASQWNGNVDLTQIDALVAIAIFNDDTAQFKLGLERLQKRLPAYFYLRTDGPMPSSFAGGGSDLAAFWFHPLKWVDGLSQETCRDNGHHTQFGLGSALNAAEAAWNQGVDVYSPNQQRLIAAMELLAYQLLSGQFAECQLTKATANRFGAWAVGYHHYHHRKGLDLPHTRKLMETPTRDTAVLNLMFSSLTHTPPRDARNSPK